MEFTGVSRQVVRRRSPFPVVNPLVRVTYLFLIFLTFGVIFVGGRVPGVVFLMNRSILTGTVALYLAGRDRRFSRRFTLIVPLNVVLPTSVLITRLRTRRTSDYSLQRSPSRGPPARGPG